jgi:thiol-disulfide isomerase/thioredoxin
MFRKSKIQASSAARRLIQVLLVLASTGLILSIEAAAELPGVAAVSDLEVNGGFVFELDGRNVEDAEIYLSEREVAYLVIASELETPLLISPRGKSVQSLRADRLTRRDGGADLAAGSVLEYLGEYETRGGEMIFEIDGKVAKLEPKPPLLGHQTFDELGRHDPKYAYNARSLSDKKTASAPAPPRAGEDVKIRVYFGSWSEICEMLVPKVQQLEDDWKQYGVRFEYYGLPKPIVDDQHAVEMEIRGVPTAVGFVDGEEVGRATGLELKTPEESLHRILAGSR